MTEDAGLRREIEAADIGVEPVGGDAFPARLWAARAGGGRPRRPARRVQDDRWLAFRLTPVRGLAAPDVLSAMRSSRAAVVEHLVGTAASTVQILLALDSAAPGRGRPWQTACEEEG